MKNGNGLYYSKTADYADLARPELQEALAHLRRYPDLLQGQDAIREWEYAMAVRALAEWERQVPFDQAVQASPWRFCDVGGAGSHFWQVLTSFTSEDIVLVDPSGGGTNLAEPGQYRCHTQSVEDFAVGTWTSPFDALFTISVIEHVPNPKPFLRACLSLLKPGGLLFLTLDCWNCEGPDVAHFHWMRQRIYNEHSIRDLVITLKELGATTFGPVDWAYHGHQLYDYSVCSLAVVKS